MSSIDQVKSDMANAKKAIREQAEKDHNELMAECLKRARAIVGLVPHTNTGAYVKEETDVAVALYNSEARHTWFYKEMK